MNAQMHPFNKYSRHLEKEENLAYSILSPSSEWLSVGTHLSRIFLCAICIHVHL